MTVAPKKYVKINGIMKLNPEYKAWKDGQQNNNTTSSSTTVLNSSQALPVISSIEDHMELNDNLGEDIPFAESANVTIEMLQDEEIAAQTGLQPDDMIDQLGELFTKYEIPIGLTNKLMLLSEYSSLEFIVDDSGSMSLDTDTIDNRTKRPLSRWVEAQNQMKAMIEIIAYVPFQQINIEFLNRTDRLTVQRDGRAPKQLVIDSCKQIDSLFTRKGPSGTTPYLEKIQESFLRSSSSSSSSSSRRSDNIARYFLGDGKPNGGKKAIDEIVKLIKFRDNPEQNPVTFISCTNDDDAVEWMKDVEEIAPYCSESDDFNDEVREVYNDQGPALPYTMGFHLICQLVGAMNPDDLDAMDESIPFTKYTLDSLLGVVSNNETYKHYFDSFVQAQTKRIVGTDPNTGQAKQIDIIRKNTQWQYDPFLTTRGPAKRIPQVQQIKQQINNAFSG